MKPIPISAASEIAERYECEQAFVIALAPARDSRVRSDLSASISYCIRGEVAFDLVASNRIVDSMRGHVRSWMEELDRSK